MRVCHISNFSVPRCGMSNFGYQFSTALRRAGHEVTDWDGCYPVIHLKEEQQDPGGTYLPADAADYDVIHVNWHPATINHYGAGHFPAGPILSVYLHDIPPWSGCPFFDRAEVRITSEPLDGCLEIPYPVADWVTDLPDPDPAFTVGWTGIRGDGLDELKSVCVRRGWALSLSDPDHWLSFEDEVRRLARSTVNVCWYHMGRGRSGAASTCLASKRPLLINQNIMLGHIQNRLGVYTAARATTLEACLEVIAEQPRADLVGPFQTCEELSWSRAATQITHAWEEARRAYA